MNFACFQRPSRYIGNEVNSIRKDADIKIALCFPDAYEIGMSHLGLKILYSIINSISYASAERVFAPWIDFESFLRKTSQPLTSLEHKRPLKDFDIAGFTLQYELSYTNVLNMLDLGGIPIKAVDRRDGYPLIIAGGPCTVNPLPLAPFIDAFVIGDGEEVIGEIIETYRNLKFQNKGAGFKEKVIRALSEIEGVYVPSIHPAGSQKVKKRIVENLDTAPFPESPLVPFTSIVHDRISIEISRGCTRGCRFCQAGMIQRPLRERSPEKVISLSQKSILHTGHEEISFTSLSSGDYRYLLPLIQQFNRLHSDDHIAVSLPSLRVGSVSREVLKEIKSIRKTGFTIAPEAGTTRLRNVINKDITEKEYEDTLEKLFTEGWKSIKLYFMTGLPTETREDIDGIIAMAETALMKGKGITGKHVKINIGISDFVPKPHTPFQWFGQTAYEELKEKQRYIKKALSKRKGINLKGQSIDSSLLEAVFSRGDSECAQLLETAWREGCRFDGWSDMFDFRKWLTASEKTGIDLYRYASRTLDINRELPWEFIDTGITKEFLISEYHKALNGTITGDCRHTCSSCGLGCHNVQEKKEIGDSVYFHQGTASSGLQSSRDFIRTYNSVRTRVKFQKTGTLRYLSHSETMTVLLRAMRRAKIPLIHSEGFHPHPKISFGPALPVGVEGTSEYFDIELPPEINPADFLLRMNGSLPQGLKVFDATPINKTKKSLNDFISRYDYEITIDKTMNKSIHSFIRLSHYLITRGGKEVDIRPQVKDIEIHNESLYIVLTDINGTKVRLYEILKELLQKPVEKIQILPIKRTRLYGYRNKQWIEP